jgi:hypothetical protein
VAEQLGEQKVAVRSGTFVSLVAHFLSPRRKKMSNIKT